jgi:hypothetical protein
MVVSEITIYDALKGMLGEEKARQVVAGIKEEVVKEVEIQKKGLATSEDIYALRAGLKEDISALKVQIAESKVEMIRWMFIFWLGTVGTLGGLIFALLHGYIK